MAAAQVQTATTFTTPSSPLPMSGLASFLNNIFASFSNLDQTLTGVNFGAANTDNPITISLPQGFTRYLVQNVYISGASADISAATCSLWTGAGGTGVSIVPSASAVTVSATADATVNNLQSAPVTDSGTRSYTSTTLYFRTQTAASGSPTASVTIRYASLP